jgi:hypothetical protein
VPFRVKACATSIHTVLPDVDAPPLMLDPAALNIVEPGVWPWHLVVFLLLWRRAEGGSVSRSAFEMFGDPLLPIGCPLWRFRALERVDYRLANRPLSWFSIGGNPVLRTTASMISELLSLGFRVRWAMLTIDSKTTLGLVSINLATNAAGVRIEILASLSCLLLKSLTLSVRMPPAPACIAAAATWWSFG